jgi:hypothetical protein
MKKILALLVVLAASLTIAYGQVTSTNGGSIQGTITDPSGAAIPGAQVNIRDVDTGSVKEVKTDGAGFYSVGPLIPGSYKVTVSMSGFETLAINTSIRIGTATSGTYKLTVGKSTETIEVDAGGIQVNTDQPGVSDVLTAQQISSLPINGRNFLDVAQIEPGVILQSGGSFDPTKAGYSALSIGGIAGRTTRILLDGQDITDETVGTTIFNVSQGAIGEFQLNRSTQDVSGDVTSTGQVLVATKSGTNGFHGELFYNFQDSRAGFATEFGNQTPFQRNQFGGSLGGPIFKDKLFFFGNAERIKQDAAQAAGVSSIFPQYQGLNIPFSYRETYSTVRLDYSGPFGGHYFARVNYNVNSVAGNFGEQFETYANRDNTPGIAGGADFQLGHFTHSFRGSYEKFHNLISDTSTSAPLDLLPGIALQNVSGTSPLLATGPNVDAPQGTFQSDAQARYDGSWTKGAHTIRFGYSINRILGGGFANFFGLGPRLRENSATLFTGPTDKDPTAPGCGNVVGAAPCPSDPLNGYHASTLAIGNNLGFFTENPGFGLLGGGTHDWREGAYVADAWKVSPNFTLSAGVRWSVDTDRANQDVAPIPCSALDPAVYTPAGGPNQAPCSGSTSLLGQFGPQFAPSVHQPYANFGPQIGFAYSPGNHKTVIRAGFGIFYDGDVFNNTTNARASLLPKGPFFAQADGQSFCSGQYANADGSITSGATVNGTTLSIAQICALPVGQAAPYVLALSQSFQGIAAKNPQGTNSGFVGETLSASGIYGAPYRTPYSEQWNLGGQRELFKGGVLSVDYIHNSTLKVGQLLDVNHLGAARYFNATAAQNAIAATLTACGVNTIDAAITACPGLHTNADGSISGATIDDFAGNGLDGAKEFLGANSPASNGKTVATGAAFPGQNPLLGSGSFILPVGRSGYDALQVVFRQQKSHPIRGIERSNLQISYNLSRILSTSNNTTGDQFFNNLSFDNDHPTAYMGRSELDRKHQVSFGGSFLLKYGPEIGIIGHFYSALPQTLTLDNTSSPVANIYRSDLTGDGTTGDLAPGTLPGDYMHRIKPSNLSHYINNFNSTVAGSLTPAGKVLVSSGLLTQAQLIALGGTVQPLVNSIQNGVAPGNADYRQVDLTFAYPIRLGHYVHTLGDAVTLEPKVAFYNIANFSNFGDTSGNPSAATFQGNLGSPGPGSVNGPTFNNGQDVQNAYRVSRQSGTFDQGAPRTIEFQLQLSF